MTTQVIDIIDTCNLACPYCFGPINSLKRKSAKEVEKLIKDETKYVVLTWWEVLLHPDIEQIIKLVYDKWKKVIFHTNGILLNKEFLDRNKKYLYRINLPIDSNIWEINEKTRWKIHLEKVKNAFKLVKNSWLKLSISTVFCSTNQDFMLELAGFLAKEVKPDLWRVFEFKNVSKLKNADYLYADKNKIKSFLEEVKKYSFKRFEFIYSDSEFYNSYE